SVNLPLTLTSPLAINASAVRRLRPVAWATNLLILIPLAYITKQYCWDLERLHRQARRLLTSLARFVWMWLLLIRRLVVHWLVCLGYRLWLRVRSLWQARHLDRALC